MRLSLLCTALLVPVLASCPAEAADREGGSYSTTLDEVLRSLTRAEISSIDQMLAAGFGKSLVKVQGKEQQTWDEVWRKCLEVKSQLPALM